jgi:hypothetical protein
MPQIHLPDHACPAPLTDREEVVAMSSRHNGRSWKLAEYIARIIEMIIEIIDRSGWRP